MEGELILLGFMMLIGQIILLQMWNNNWFKKENFKIKKKNIMDENRLRLKKLEKELGLPHDKAIPEMKGGLGQYAQLLPLLNKLNADQISALFEMFMGQGFDVDESGGIPGILGAIPPELIEAGLQGFLGKLGEGGGGEFVGQGE